MENNGGAANRSPIKQRRKSNYDPITTQLPHGNRIDDHLHRAFDTGLTKDKHELMHAFFCQAAGVHGLQDENAVFLQQCDMAIKHLVTLCGRYSVDTPGARQSDVRRCV
jgi:hypothetical protein